MERLRSGELARACGVNLETLRYYERRGLLPQPRRTAGGYRLFPPESTSRVRFIKNAQSLGFTLKEIGELLSLRLDSTTTCADVRGKAQRKIADIDDKIVDLRRMKVALAKLTKACSGHGSSRECPILEALDDEEQKTANG